MNTSGLIDDRTWRRRRWASFGAALALIVLMIPVSQAQAESLGCIVADRIGTTATGVGTSGTFEEGEVVTVSVTSTDGATQAILTVNGGDEGSTDIPGTLQYAIPATDSYTLSITANGTATFDMDCSAGGSGDGGDDGDSDLPPPAPSTGDYCDSGKAFGKSVSGKAKAGDTQGKDGYNAGTHQGFSSCKDG